MKTRSRNNARNIDGASEQTVLIAVAGMPVVADDGKKLSVVTRCRKSNHRRSKALDVIDQNSDNSRLPAVAASTPAKRSAETPSKRLQDSETQLTHKKRKDDSVLESSTADKEFIKHGMNESAILLELYAKAGHSDLAAKGMEAVPCKETASASSVAEISFKDSPRHFQVDGGTSAIRSFEAPSTVGAPSLIENFTPSLTQLISSNQSVARFTEPCVKDLFEQVLAPDSKVDPSKLAALGDAIGNVGYALKQVLAPDSKVDPSKLAALGDAIGNVGYALKQVLAPDSKVDPSKLAALGDAIGNVGYALIKVGTIISEKVSSYQNAKEKELIAAKKENKLLKERIEQMETNHIRKIQDMVCRMV